MIGSTKSQNILGTLMNRKFSGVWLIKYLKEEHQDYAIKMNHGKSGSKGDEKKNKARWEVNQFCTRFAVAAVF